MPLRISRRTVYSVGIYRQIWRRNYFRRYKYRRKNSVGNSVAFLRFSGSENLREMVRSNTPIIVFLVLNSYDYANKSFNKWNEDSLFLFAQA